MDTGLCIHGTQCIEKCCPHIQGSIQDSSYVSNDFKFIDLPAPSLCQSLPACEDEEVMLRHTFHDMGGEYVGVAVHWTANGE